VRSEKSSIKLRGHHLLCLHFFTGEGYNLEFIWNLKEILIRAQSGEEIEVCSGVDDVCSVCPFLKERRCHYDKYAENEIQKMDRDAIKLLRIETGMKVMWFDIQERAKGILRTWKEDYCKSCNWRKVCEKTALYQQINEKY
jgi:hypothetical protein